MKVLPPTLLALAVALAAGCFTPDAGDAAPTTTTPATTGGGNATAGEAEAIQVTVGEGGVGVPPTLYTLAPKTLELTAGTTYNLTLKNNGRAAHDLVIDGLDVKIASVPAGQTSEGVLFTPAEPGTYAMYCTIAGGSPASHKDNGMRGEVVVS